MPRSRKLSTPDFLMDELIDLSKQAISIRNELLRQSKLSSEADSLPESIAILENLIYTKVNSIVKAAKQIKEDLEVLVDIYRASASTSSKDNKPIKKTKETLDKIDDHLRTLERSIHTQCKFQVSEMLKEMTQAGSDIDDFEMEVEFNYILSEDDPAYAEDSDNILTSRDGKPFYFDKFGKEESPFEIETVDWPPESPLISRQCWYIHDLIDHSYGPGTRRLEMLELLRIEEIWINVITKRQYTFNLRSGQYDVTRRINNDKLIQYKINIDAHQ